jgi:hypothetical protein
VITFKCEIDGCINKDIEYNFAGSPETAMCGGCKATLVGTDSRPDPEIPEATLPISIG